jgi:hypothetical protein
MIVWGCTSKNVGGHIYLDVFSRPPPPLPLFCYEQIAPGFHPSTLDIRCVSTNIPFCNRMADTTGGYETI